MLCNQIFDLKEDAKPLVQGIFASIAKVYCRKASAPPDHFIVFVPDTPSV